MGSGSNSGTKLRGAQLDWIEREAQIRCYSFGRSSAHEWSHSTESLTNKLGVDLMREENSLPGEKNAWVYLNSLNYNPRCRGTYPLPSVQNLKIH